MNPDDLRTLPPSVFLYLDLLKKSLTDTLRRAEPSVDTTPLRFIHDFAQHYIQGDAVSMLPLVRFDNLQSCMIQTIRDGIPGDFIETGAWRGGATIFMRGVLKALGVEDRTVWVADSFEGLPEPDPERFPLEAKAHNGPVMSELFYHLAAPIEEVRENFEIYGLLDDQVRFLKGWFKDTLPSAPIEQLAVLRLDGDYYESTMDALQSLYDKVSEGGFVIVDDYGEGSWTYCRQAVDEFRRERGIVDRLLKVDTPAVYWRKAL
jgi:hypothetical protein